MSERDDARKIQELQRKLRRGEVDKGVRRMLALLEAARREVVAEIADTDWDRFYLPRMTAAIDRHLDQWRDLALRDLTSAQATFWELGAAATNATMAVMGVGARFPELPTSLLQTLTAKTSQRIGGLTQSAKDRIDRTIATGLLSGRPRHEVIEQIGRHLTFGAGSGKPQGLFGSIGARATFIYQQEVGMAYATAQELRRQQAAKYAPELKKVWKHDGHPIKPRPDHVAMHGQVRDQDEAFLNPITGEELDYPRDPNADISETAGCTCDVVLWRPLYGDVREFIGPATGREAVEQQAA
ncbi:hypothetical protein [Candidatus Nitrospira bockiana]